MNRPGTRDYVYWLDLPFGRIQRRRCELIVSAFLSRCRQLASDPTFTPHRSGWLRCDDCFHYWIGIAPLGGQLFECPRCKAFAGRWQ